MKEQKEAKRKVKATEICVYVDIYSKLRMITIQGGEDDTTLHNFNEAMCIAKDEKHVQVEMMIASALEVHALSGNQGNDYSSNYSSKLCLERRHHGVHDGCYVFACCD